ncbi:unnamed protein product [Mytilus edulis]|uniref:COR domain-containing protein n=1 Tax=Mytilus edulis TaxID=6550 RepID=A0A8S3Q9E4_MYTED|nr:unnamed protein product [Mytilus edulis]
MGHESPINRNLHDSYKDRYKLISVLPDAINKLSEDDKTRYNNLMQTEKTEKRYFVRTMIVESDDDKVSRIRRALNPNAEDKDIHNMQVHETNSSQSDAMSTDKKETTTDAKVRMDKNNDNNESSSASEANVSHDNNKNSNEPASLEIQEATDKKGNLLKMKIQLRQKEFYATHQAFLTSSAVYLVVADMKDDISKQGLSQCFVDFQHIGDFKTREKELDDQMNQVLGFQTKYHHLHNKFYLSNTKDSDEEFEKLRYAIYEAARKMGNWGNTFPLKWILLEHLIEINKNNGKNFINFTEMSNLAKHPDINILKKEDLLLFLRFQHNVGNIIFFENIPDLIILRPQWLADAFRCLVSDRVDNRRLHHLEDWTLFKQQGKISESLIKELFESKDGSQFSGQKNNLYKVMEKLDIIVKIENSSYYIMPSAMPSSTFDVVCEKFGILTQNCKKTSWLCFKFEFLPPSFFNHLSAWFIRNYNPSKVEGGIALYRGICMFDIDRSGGTKILVTMSTDTIALQIVTFSEHHAGFGSACSNIYIEVSRLFEDIKQRYRVIMSFKLHFKCSDGYYFQDTFEYEKLKSEKECFCIQHKQMHRSEQIYSPWMNNEVCF